MRKILTIILFDIKDNEKLSMTLKSLLNQDIAKDNKVEVVYCKENTKLDIKTILDNKYVINSFSGKTMTNSDEKNLAVDNMSSETKYVFFLRAGSVLVPNIISKMLEKIIDMHCDIVHFTESNYANDFLINFYVDSKIWRKNIFLKHKFEKNNYFEDFYLFNRLVSNEYKTIQDDLKIYETYNNNKTDNLNYLMLKDYYLGMHNLLKIIFSIDPLFYKRQESEFLKHYLDMVSLAYSAKVIKEEEFENDLNYLIENSMISREEYKKCHKINSLFFGRIRREKIKHKFKYDNSHVII